MSDVKTNTDVTQTAFPDAQTRRQDSEAPAMNRFSSAVLSALRILPGPLIGLILICIVFSYLSPYFLTTRNMLNIFSQVSEIGIMAVGAALVIIIGGIDLSVGAVLAVSLMVNAWLYREFGVPFPLSCLAGVAVGALVGLVNGLLSTYGRIQPFVATLATMSACSGIALFITNGGPITGFPDYFTALTATRILGIPLETILMIAIYLIAAYWLTFRPAGRALYAVGGGEEVARLSGINTQRVKLGVYVIAGVLAAVAGLILGSRLDTAHPTAGASDLLSVIAVVVIGGASLSGGSGGMLGTFVGLLIIGVLRNGMALINVSPNLQPVVIGVAIIIAVILDRRSGR
ncbi:ribose ABC transporter membrane subunit (plasmid) [Shinella sp. WSC3-e]|nr:ABC transporter permease [Shinella sp. YE25]CAI0334499.1 ribose ABC transporter membrane subunit [Rhizobiaceae bacterium]CAK7260675.1 ribose ABC transporter membrane subunit [Shinella sp. WSC3-e]